MRRHSTGTPSVPLTELELKTLARKVDARERALSKRKPRNLLKRYADLGLPARVTKTTSKKVSYETDSLQWIPASLYRFPTARPLTTQEQEQFERNFRKGSPMKPYQLPDIRDKMGRMNF